MLNILQQFSVYTRIIIVFRYTNVFISIYFRIICAVLNDSLEIKFK